MLDHGVLAARLAPLAVLLALAAPATASAEVPSGNLLINPGADADDGAGSASETIAPPGWFVTGNFTAVKYGVTNFPTVELGTSIGGSPNFFAGGPGPGPGPATSRGEQQLDLSGAAAEIDAGAVSMTLRGHLGGFAGDGDNARVVATFQDEQGDVPLGQVQIGPVSAADRNNATTMLARSATVDVPARTRVIDVFVTMTRTDGSYIDGYADNLSLTLDRAPVATNDAATVAQGSPATAIDVLANDDDPDGGTKLVASVTQPANGSTATSGDRVTYEPKAGFCTTRGGSPDTFSYKLNGGSSATVAVTVTCPGAKQDPPAPPPPAPAEPAPAPAPPATLPAPALLRVGLCAAPAASSARAAATLLGTTLGDVVIGTIRRDTISGLAGGDCLLGLAGDDVLDGGSGDDVLRGDGVCPVPLRDVRACGTGASGDDTLVGGLGRDALYGGDGDDLLSGGDGTDRLLASSGNDRVSGGSGDDDLSGGAGADELTGGSGADRITGASGNDRVTAGSGDDRVIVRDGSRDVVTCGGGNDSVLADRRDSVHRSCESVSRRR